MTKKGLGFFMQLNKLLEKAPEAIKHSFESKSYSEGKLIISRDEMVKYLYILTEGVCEVYHQNFSGALLSYTLMRAYCCFGEVELINNKLKPMSVIAKTDCQMLLLKRPFVLQWMKLDFNFNLYLFEQLAEKLRDNSEKLFRISSFTVKDRILYSLYTHYKIGDLEQLTKKQISYEAATPLRSINRAIALLNEEGWIEYKKKQFFVQFPKKIETYLTKIME